MSIRSLSSISIDTRASTIVGIWCIIDVPAGTAGSPSVMSRLTISVQSTAPVSLDG